MAKDFTIKSNIDIVTKELQDKVNQWLEESGSYILDESNKIAPIDEGTLINSSSFVVSDNQVTIGYDTPYAMRQHEDVTLKHTNGRQAKFLENPIKESVSLLKQRLEDILKED